MSFIRGFSFFWITIFSIFGSSMNCANEVQSMKLRLSNSNYSDFADFLYFFSAQNRLNVQWFGWYKVSNATTKWFERSDRKSNFKINVHLLSENNGYLYFSNGFDEKSVNVIIDYGENKEVWLDVVDDFKNQVQSKGWVSQKK